MSRVRVSTPLGLHVPGTTLLHRAPAGLKLVVLALLGAAVAFVRAPLPALALLTVLLGAWALARLPLRALRQVRSIGLLLLGLGAFRWWHAGPGEAIGMVAGLASVVLAAAIVTATTPSDDLVSVLVRGLRGLTRVPVLGRVVRPEAFALAVALVLRTVPTLLAVAHGARDAARARGARGTRAWLLPTLLRTVGHAVRTGEAIHARGLLDDSSPVRPRSQG
ncbi:CbiQ family ECF transporter T component [Sanguibacter sp. A247]|uniref:CbiQ family ECF transporter T component n=1 Tax=unclassified Sanguibacter TaxID=2645534 RepID=UPI003FD715C4